MIITYILNRLSENTKMRCNILYQIPKPPFFPSDKMEDEETATVVFLFFYFSDMIS